MGSLERTTKSASAPLGTNVERRWSRHTLAGMAARAVPGHRAASCGTKVVPGRAAAVVVAPGGTAHLTGVRSCGSVWACPYCAAKVGRYRALELRGAVAEARRQGLHVYLLTATVAHAAHDRLAALLEVLLQAMRRLRSGRAWVKFADEVGVVGLVRNLEVTWGAGSGWHPHAHALLFTREPLTAQHVEELKTRWVRAVGAWGGHASMAHGLKVSSDRNDVDGYLSKAEEQLAEAEGREPRRGWGAAEELVFAHAKQGRGERYTPWGLLREAAEADDPEPWLARFAHYAHEFGGRRQLVWSRGLRALLCVGPELEDEEVAQIAAEGETVHVFTGLEWRAVQRFRAVPAVLDAAEEGGAAGVRRVLAWLLELLRGVQPELFGGGTDRAAA